MNSPPRAPFLQPSAALRRVVAHADACLEFCRRESGHTQIPLPVPVEEWIESPLRIRFGVQDLSDRGARILGLSQPRARTILVSDRITHEGRFRFTCAHELGHVVMHQRYRGAFADKHVGGAPRLEYLEWQADRFASAFLMPLALLIRELFAACEEAGMDATRCVTELAMPTMESEWLWRKYVLPAIVDRFGVSRTAAIIRFGDLRLRDRRAFLLPTVVARLMNPRRRPVLSRFRLENGFPTRRAA